MINTLKRVFKKILNAPIRINKLINFNKFQNQINKSTVAQHNENIELTRMYSEGYLSQDLDNSLYEIGSRLNKECLNQFNLKFSNKKELRVLMHLPPPDYSPAGFSIFTNLKNAFEYMGVDCEFLNWDDETTTVLKEFQPSIFLSSDSEPYLQRINWRAIRQYKQEKKLQIGLTASIEAYGNSPLEARLELGRRNGVDFYYSFRSENYIKNRDGYMPFAHQGYRVICIEFSANPLIYVPVNGVPRDLPFVFLGSSNFDKFERYNSWFGPIISEVDGFINGPGWKHMDSKIPLELNKYLYARAKVGINLHLEEQIEWPCELNERTYVLAACGVPQLIDNPKLLGDRFSSNAFFSGSTPSEYRDLFHHIIKSPAEATLRAKLALEEVYAGHTTFHRIEKFISQLEFC